MVTCVYPKCACQNVENGNLVGDIYCCEDPPSTQLGGYWPQTAQDQCNPPCLAACNNPANPTITFHCCPAPPAPTTTPAPTPGVSCFPASARVNLDNGKSVTMAELQIGDHVQTGRRLN